ncbi:unnamed protein product, partial [Tetraodon nigroviridis]
LKKELEEELKLSSEDLSSHAWYHGPLRREAAEALLERNGDFLVRDSSSTPRDYVLTCFWMNMPMHFKIIRVVLRPKKGYSRELFQFEEDRFDNIPALIRLYVGGRRPISQASGAVISHPITRTLPLRVIREQQAVPDSKGVEVSLQIWRMLDAGLHFSRRSLTATYGLVELESCFQLDRFDSLLLPQNNRPLEPSVLLVLKELFNRSNANATALHMLSVDCQVALGTRTHPFVPNISPNSTHQRVAC